MAWYIELLIVITLWIFLNIIWKVNWPFNAYVKLSTRAHHITKLFFKITLVNNYIQKETCFFKISWSYTWTKKTITTSRQFIATSIIEKCRQTENNGRCRIDCFNFKFQISKLKNKSSSEYNLVKRLILFFLNNFPQNSIAQKPYLSNLFKT